VNNSVLKEARDNADAARLNMETLLTQSRPGRDLSGTLRNAKQQLAKAAKLLEDAEFDAAQATDKPMKKHGGEHLVKLCTWTKVPGGIELAQHGRYQVSVTGMRGDWYYSVAKASNPEPLRQGNTKSKALAKLEGLGWADELGDEDERRATRLRTAGIGFDKLEAALENARSSFASDRRSCSYEGSAPATLDDVHNIVDSFVASLIHSLDPEPG